jgi:glucokinase
VIVLAGDVGGTNARLALVDIDADSVKMLHIEKYPSPEYPGLEPVVQRFLADTGGKPERACYGIAGPVVDQRVVTPNLSWTIDGAQLARETGIAHTQLINDFSAAGFGVRRLGTADVVTLQDGARQEHGPIGLIGAGTGLGHGFVLWDGQYRVYASEAGHGAFAPRTALEWQLVEFLLKEFDRVSWERVVSGPGLAHLYRFLADSGYAPEQQRVKAEMATEDPPAVVTRHGVAGSDRLCVKALDMFVSAYGAQAGHLAITIVATGGIYIAGGIAPRIVEKLKDGTFMTAFKSLGRLAEFGARVPVHVIMNPDVGLLGAATAAFESPTPQSPPA